MKINLFLCAFAALLFVQCGKSNDPFLIKKGAVGDLTDHTKMKQLDSLFSKDSIVKINSSPNALETQGEVEIFGKDGKKLLLLSPEKETDPNSTITDIVVYDPRFKTEKGLSINSTFKDFTDQYTISDMQRIINGVLVFFADTDIYLLFDSKYLTEEAKNDPDLKLEAKYIQADAPIKYLRIGWNPDSK